MATSYAETDRLSHSKYTILGMFYGTVHGSRNAEPYDFSRVSRINDSIVPQPRCRVIRISFSLVSLHHLCLESFLFFFVPLHFTSHICTQTNKDTLIIWRNKMRHLPLKRTENTLPESLAFSCWLSLFEPAHQQPELFKGSYINSTPKAI